MRRRRNSYNPPISIEGPRRGFSTPSPIRPIARINNSPTLFFGDVGNFDSAFPSRKKVELKRTVREANDACLWLRAAGFPQYVQMYEDGQFPINLSQIQVERDHAFLEQADIDSLVRRLNILNRCADLMEEIKSKKEDDSEDESQHRAISDHWTFRKRNKKWSRRSRSHLREDSFSSSLEDILAEDSETNGASNLKVSPLLLVTELRTSLTNLDKRGVKTYSFLPGDDQVPKILVGTFPTENGIEYAFDEEATSNGSGVFDVSMDDTPHEVSGDEGLGGDDDDEFFEYDSNTFPRGGIDTFAMDMFSTFESNLVKLRSQSLPDLFSNPHAELYHPLDDDDDNDDDDDPNSSSASVSTSSNLHSSKDSILDDNTLSLETSLPSTPNQEPKQNSSELERKLTTLPTHRKENSLSSEAYESAESEFSRSRPETPSSPQKRIGAGRKIQLSEKWSSSSVPSARRSTEWSECPKWHSFQKAHSYRQVFRPVRTLIPIEELSVGQISVLKKLSLIKLTALIELYKAKSNIARIIKGRKHKLPDIRHKSVFGVPLLTNVQRTGKALPPSILAALDYLTQGSGLETSGLFRRGASKAKIDGLKLLTEANPDLSDYSSFTCYEVADMIKLYFRQLPEPLLTSKLSETLLMIQENVPSQLRLQALQGVMLLMPDENREALQTLLVFLKQVADNSHVNQMDAKNLAVCLAPSLFALSQQLPKPVNLTRVGSFRRTAVNGHNAASLNSPAAIARNRMVNESVASSQCLSEMISQANKLFLMPADMLQVCHFTHLEAGDPVPYHELDLDKADTGSTYLESCVQCLHKELKRKFKGWIHHSTPQKGVDVSYLKPTDGIPLRVWRGVVEIDASPDAVLKKLWIEKYVWTGEYSLTRQVARVDDQTEILQYTTPSPSGLTDRDHCLLRTWDFDPVSDTYIIVSTSVSHPSASLLAGIRATELATRYVIERVDRDKTRLTFICRVDMKGRSSEYYNTGFGPYLASSVANLRDSFHPPDFLETTV
ncbi:stAR-related lipid transfer protein 13-like isoform X3 [Halichondria panicea]|uniref:stAR-related lipid transfer protein 13-like isoform X3 n=1 Tax=Halichondria panicea TaxID=6063 RepID=UPI00312B8D2A